MLGHDVLLSEYSTAFGEIRSASIITVGRGLFNSCVRMFELISELSSSTRIIVYYTFLRPKSRLLMLGRAVRDCIRDLAG